MTDTRENVLASAIQGIVHEDAGRSTDSIRYPILVMSDRESVRQLEAARAFLSADDVYASVLAYDECMESARAVRWPTMVRFCQARRRAVQPWIEAAERVHREAVERGLVEEVEPPMSLEEMMRAVEEDETVEAPAPE